MRDHDHDHCHSVYVPDVGEIVFSLREGCDWVGHDDAVAEAGYCPVCQH